MNNLYEIAFYNNEVYKFLAGEEPYYYEGKSDNFEPQNVSQAFDVFLYPFYVKNPKPEIADSFLFGLYKLIKDCPDHNKAAYLAYDWIWYYLNCLNKKKSNSSKEYEELFEIDLSFIEIPLKQLVKQQEKSLKIDFRWAGNQNNSSAGLWEPMLRIAKDIKNRLGIDIML